MQTREEKILKHIREQIKILDRLRLYISDDNREIKEKISYLNKLFRRVDKEIEFLIKKYPKDIDYGRFLYYFEELKSTIYRLNRIIGISEEVDKEIIVEFDRELNRLKSSLYEIEQWLGREIEIPEMSSPGDNNFVSEVNDSYEDRLRKKFDDRLKKFREIRKYFTDKELYILFKRQFGVPSSSGVEHGGAYNLFSLGNEEKEYLENEISGKIIIELGCGNAGYNHGHFFQDLGCKRYYGIDPQYRDTIIGIGMRIIGTDALSFLLECKSNSAIIVSFAFLEDGALYTEVDKLHNKYINLLMKEIYRVSIKGAITFHGLEIDGGLIEAGFNIEKNVPPKFNKNVYGMGKYLMVLRK